MSNPVFKCYVVLDECASRFYAYIYSNDTLRIPICNWYATPFTSLEELVVNLQMKFPECHVDKHMSNVVFRPIRGHEIKGIKQEVLRQCFEDFVPLI